MTKGKIRVFLALFVLSVFLVQNCATIARGTSQKIPVTSNPIGARIIVDGEEMGNAPLNLKLKRKKSHVIRIEKQGYNPLEIGITKKSSIYSVGTSILGNVLMGGLVGFLYHELVYPEIAADISYGLDMILLFGIPILGCIGGTLVDFSSGANYSLSPKELNVTLTKIGEKPQSNIILIDTEKFQDIIWIRIKCADNDDEDIINLD